MSKILVVDDDLELTTIIAGYLSRQNHKVETACDGRSALDILAVSGFDVIVLDVDMPDISGIQVCTQLRDSGTRTPIIMLTGRASISDKTQGLDCGADDYLTKPFSLSELYSRVNALIRRYSSTYTTTLKCTDIVLDFANHTVTKAGVLVHLLPIDFALLEFFMRHPLQTFSKEVLISRVWDSDTEATDDAIRSSIKRLRQKLDNGADEESSIIETQRRVGYRFVGERT